jgi:hypothetical protein
MRSSILDILEGVRGGRIERADITDRMNALVWAPGCASSIGSDLMNRGIAPEK